MHTAGCREETGGLRGHSQRIARPSPPDGRHWIRYRLTVVWRVWVRDAWRILAGRSARPSAATFCSGGAPHRALAELGLDTRDAIGFPGSAAISLEITFPLISAKLQITAHRDSLAGRFSDNFQHLRIVWKFLL